MFVTIYDFCKQLNKNDVATVYIYNAVGELRYFFRICLETLMQERQRHRWRSVLKDELKINRLYVYWVYLTQDRCRYVPL